MIHASRLEVWGWLMGRALSLVAVLEAATPVLAQGPLVPAQMYPRSAFLVPAADAGSLQQALDTQGVVRLEGAADYSAGPALTLRTGYQLFGLGDRVPPITIAPGSTGIVLANVQVANPGILFPPSSSVTSANLFLEVQGLFTIRAATLEDNVLVGLENGNIIVDSRDGGYLRNNRFIRVRAQNLNPLLTLRGDLAHQSYNNVFLWLNQLTQPNGAGVIQDQGDVTLIGWDDEAYAPSPTAPIYAIEGVDTLRLWTFSGNTPSTTFPNWDISATEAHLFGLTMGGSFHSDGGTDGGIDERLLLRAPVERALEYDSPYPPSDENPLAFRLGGAMSPRFGETMLDHSEPVVGPLPESEQSTLVEMLQPTRVGSPWERPAFEPPPDPAGPHWNEGLECQADSTDLIQSLIDANRVVLLDAGLYYVSAPLRLQPGTRLIGAGAGLTAIIAKDAGIDLLVDGRSVPDGGGISSGFNFQLGDLTLEGGANGVHFAGIPADGGFPGWGDQYTRFYVSHVVFRNFSNAGFLIDQVFGMDNGLFADVAFVGCDAGFAQVVDPRAPGGGPNSGYMDKVVFFHSQFIANGFGVRLGAHRADNLNYWINSLFQDNARGAFWGSSQTNTTFANCDFINNGGSPSVTVNGGRGSYISCYFRADENGEALLGGIANIEGSRFERGSSSVATVFSNSSNVYFDPVTGAYVNYSGDFVWNSQSDGIPLGNVEFGAFWNNSFPDRPDLSTIASIVFLGAVTQVADGPTNPLPQLLFGSSYATPDGGGADSDGGVLTLGDAQRAGAGHPRAGRAHQLAHDASVHAPKPGRKGPGDSSPR